MGYNNMTTVYSSEVEYFINNPHALAIISRDMTPVQLCSKQVILLRLLANTDQQANK